jgi:hypothetical protein
VSNKLKAKQHISHKMMNMLVMEETSTLSPRNECYAKMVSVKEKKGYGKME